MPLAEAIEIARIIEMRAVRESGWERGRTIKEALDLIISTALLVPVKISPIK
jgi:hypothetical protein